MSGTKIQKYKLREAITEELAAAGITEAPRLKAPAVRPDRWRATESGHPRGCL